MASKRRLTKGWCAWGDRACVSTCPVDAVDNFGNPYKACPAFRLKTQAEITMSDASNEQKGKE